MADEAPDPGQPFVAPCRTLTAAAPLGWLRRGWRDMWAAPRQSLTYGAIVVLLSFALATITVRYGGYFELLALVTGFILIAPVLAVGTYAISLQLERGRCRRFGAASARSSGRSATCSCSR